MKLMKYQCFLLLDTLVCIDICLFNLDQFIIVIHPLFMRNMLAPSSVLRKYLVFASESAKNNNRGAGVIACAILKTKRSK